MEGTVLRHPLSLLDRVASNQSSLYHQDESMHYHYKTFEAENKGFNKKKVYNNVIRYGYQLKNDESLNEFF